MGERFSYLRNFLIFALFFAALVSARCGTGSEPGNPKRSFGTGLTYTGGLIRAGFGERWAVDARFLYDVTNTSNGDVKSQIIGARGYFSFRTRKKLQPYVGIEADYVSSKLNNGTSYDVTGFTTGGFLGLEYYLTNRISLGVDMGPYYIKLKESSLSQSASEFDFVANSFLNFYIF